MTPHTDSLCTWKGLGGKSKVVGAAGATESRQSAARMARIRSLDKVWQEVQVRKNPREPTANTSVGFSRLQRVQRRTTEGGASCAAAASGNNEADMMTACEDMKAQNGQKGRSERSDGWHGEMGILLQQFQ